MKAREVLIPEYENRNRPRVFSEPRNFQGKAQLDETQDEEITDSNFGFMQNKGNSQNINTNNQIDLSNQADNYKDNSNQNSDLTEMPIDDVSAMVPSKGVHYNHSNAFKVFNNEENNPQLNNFRRDASNSRRKQSTDKPGSSKRTNNMLPPADGFSVPLMNTWTNNKFVSKKDSDKNTKKISFRPRSGNPSPTKMYNDNDKLNSAKVIYNYNQKQNLYNPQKHNMNIASGSNAESIILRSYSNTKQNITPVSVQSQLQNTNPPQPHQRNIKRNIMFGPKQRSIQNKPSKVLLLAQLFKLMQYRFNFESGLYYRSCSK